MDVKFLDTYDRWIDHVRNTRYLNLDLSHRCPLECPQCDRQRHFKKNDLKIPGKDMTLEDFNKITNFARKILFCGRLSDPIHHPKFINFLKICNDKGIKVQISTASSFKPHKWYIEAFKAHPTADWTFGIDGLPDQSHNYRKNQNGKKLFDIMIESKKYLTSQPIWQYIMFKYNEHNLDNAMQIAKENNLLFRVIRSSRWKQQQDNLMPSLKNWSVNE